MSDFHVVSFIIDKLVQPYKNLSRQLVCSALERTQGCTSSTGAFPVWCGSSGEAIRCRKGPEMFLQLPHSPF